MTRDEHLDRAAEIVLAGIRQQLARTPRQAAEAAWYPGHSLTVDEIEARIIQRRAEDAALLAAQGQEAA